MVGANVWRWLLDGSVVSGNPVYTNLIWNEIGRGTDLKELEAWLDKNQKTVDEITAAVKKVYTDPLHLRVQDAFTNKSLLGNLGYVELAVLPEDNNLIQV